MSCKFVINVTVELEAGERLVYVRINGADAHHTFPVDDTAAEIEKVRGEMESGGDPLAALLTMVEDAAYNVGNRSRSNRR